MDSEYDYVFKIIIIGDSGVGKSCILLRFADDTFTPSHISTIGVDFKINTLSIENKVIKLMLWDSAGQERFRNITSTYYRGSHGIIVVFDLTIMESFNNIKMWIKEIEKFAGNEVCKILVGNKCDLVNRRVVEHNTAKQLADDFNMQYIETSAKDSINIHEAFENMATEIKHKIIQADKINEKTISKMLENDGKIINNNKCPC